MSIKIDIYHDKKYDVTNFYHNILHSMINVSKCNTNTTGLIKIECDYYLKSKPLSILILIYDQNEPIINKKYDEVVKISNTSHVPIKSIKSITEKRYKKDHLKIIKETEYSLNYYKFLLLNNLKKNQQLFIKKIKENNFNKRCDELYKLYNKDIKKFSDEVKQLYLMEMRFFYLLYV